MQSSRRSNHETAGYTSRQINDFSVRRHSIKAMQAKPELVPQTQYPALAQQGADPTFFQEEFKREARQLTSLRNHLIRMLETGGHSWSNDEHNVLFAPLRKRLAAGWQTLPVGIRDSRLLPGRSKSWQVSYFFILLAALVALPAGLMIHNDLQARRYELSSATKQLVGAPVVVLDKQLVFDAKTGAYQYNSAAADGIKAAAQAGSDQSKSFGGSKYYGVNLAQGAGHGQTYTDAQTKLTFSLIPQFDQLDGKHEDGHIVYPIKGGQAVYTLKTNGLKEDVVLNSPANTATLTYKLQLPASLQARLLSDGSIGIYSANPSLFGDISYGNTNDQTAVEKARTSGPKNNMVFQIPTPVITETGKAYSAGKAAFELDGNTVRVTASNLARLRYPISIDPSVVVQSANNFMNGNSDASNAIVTAGSVSRAALTGGTINAGWGSTGGNTFGSGSAFISTVVYNGYVYVTSGGTNASWYATLGSNGTIGAWSSGTTVPQAVLEASSVAYNGYLYIIGGTQSNGTGAASTVLAALICTATNTGVGGCSGTPGSIGSWTTGNSTNLSARYGLSVASYNGYIYAIGGCTYASSNGVICGGIANDNNFTNVIQKAAVNTDGTLGNWTTETTPAFSGRYLLSTSVYNGYLYASGGCTTTSSGSCIAGANDVWYTPINSDGSLGSWQSTAAFTTARQAFGFTALNGYMYVIGGCTTASNCNSNSGTTDTQYAPIYANGSIGTWQSTVAPPTERYGQGVITNGNYITMIGGCKGNNLNCTGSLDNSSITTPIDPEGTIGSFTTSANTFTTAREGASTVAYNGNLYIIGGDSGGAPFTTHSVMVATIDGNTGSLGTFADTTGLPVTVTYASAVAYNGFIYLFGGCHDTRPQCNGSFTSSTANTYYAAINSDGTIGSWSVASTTGIQAMYGQSMVAYNNYLYVIGGDYQGSLQNTIYYRAINASGAPTGNWLTASQTLSTNKAFFGAAVNGGYLYVTGGCTAGNFNCTVTTNTVEYAKLSDTGGLSTNFTSTTSLPTARGDFAMAIANGYMYVTGGRTGATYYNSTQFAPINSDGSVGTWTASAAGTLPTARASLRYAVSNGMLYAMGGYDGTTYSGDSLYANINNGGSGVANAWHYTHNSTDDGTSFVAGFSGQRSGLTAVATNGYIYVMGGYNGFTYLSDVQYAPLNANGTVGTWATTTSFATGRSNFASITSNGYLYVMGGYNGGNLGDDQYALICTGSNNGVGGCGATAGSVGTWLTTTALGINESYTGAAIYNGYVYLSGGASDGNTVLGGTRYAPLNSDGTVGAWAATSNFSNARYGLGSLAYNGYLYITGGFNGAAFFNDVQYALICTGSNNGVGGCGATAGSVGTWLTTTSFNNPRSSLTASAHDGYLYIMGGGNVAYLNDVQYAPINNNGTLGNWTTTSSLLNLRGYSASVAANGNLYVLGGLNSSNTYSDVQYAPLNVIARTAHYSRLIDLASTVNGTSGGDPQITRYGFKGTGPANGVNFCSTSATTTTPALSSLVCNTTYGFGVPVASKGYGRYSFINLIINDSQNAAFPDSNPSAINEIDVFFHAAPGRRLRGGQTFTNSTAGTAGTSQFDTETP